MYTEGMVNEQIKAVKLTEHQRDRLLSNVTCRYSISPARSRQSAVTLESILMRPRSSARWFLTEAGWAMVRELRDKGVR